MRATTSGFDGAAPDQLAGESTPFYLYDLAAQRRMADGCPRPNDAIIRDPVDRAYSN